MRWSRLSEKERHAVEERRRAGKTIRPEHEPPEIPPHLASIWAGFWDLDSCRSVGMAAGRIPYTAMLAWLDEHGVVDPEARLWHVELWQALDAEVLRDVSDRTISPAGEEPAVSTPTTTRPRPQVKSPAVRRPVRR